jgi:hypothetical protein
MDAFRQLQQRRIAAAQPQPAAKVLTFPSRRPAEVRDASNVTRNAARNWWSGASAAAIVIAMLGMGLHLHNGVSTVSAPTLATAPVVSAPQSSVPAASSERTVAIAKPASRNSLLVQASRAMPSGVQTDRANDSSSNDASSEVASTTAVSLPVELAKAGNVSAPVALPAAQPSAQAAVNASPLIHLASAGATGNAAQNAAQNATQNATQNAAAQSASSTWPGYSNLMYCDPVVCSGPMQVVHIKVPVDQVKPNVGQSDGKSFVNADVVIGPDGVARAIRVAN